MKKLLLVSTFSLSLSTSSLLPAATVGQTDAFETGLDGWRVGGGSGPSGPQVIAGGIDGDFLTYTTDAVNTGGRFLIMNSAQWTGDYVSSGISGISAIAKNEGDVELQMRLLLEGPGGGFLSVEAMALPVGGDWQNIHFPISSADLTGGPNLANTLTSVSQIRIFHNPSASFPGPFTNASMSIDNIRAVPEPASSIMLLCLVVVATFWRRHSTSLRSQM